VYAKLGRYSEAVEAYQRAMVLDPAVTFDYGNLIQSLQALGRKQEIEQIRVKAKQFGYEG
jgi:tetratricopeptide (TPR) repeat protein